MKKIEKLADIAALAGVTAATASRALSGDARISAATRDRVRSIANEHGYRVNQTARNLRMGKTQSIGVVLPLGHESAQRVSDPFYTALIGNLMEGLARREHAMLLSAVTPTDGDWLADLSRAGRVDGIIVLCQSDQDPVLRAVGKTYRPLVVWGELAPDDRAYCCVGTDNHLGGRLATEHLLARGCRRIAFAGMTDIPELAARHAGYLEAHAAAGAAPGPRIPVPLAFDAASSLFAERLAADVEIDGIVAASDMIAIGAIRGLAQCGRRVPDDVPVVGYDDVTLAGHVLPPLTTIRQDLQVAAETMLNLLFQRIRGEETKSVRVPLRLVERLSA